MEPRTFRSGVARSQAASLSTQDPFGPLDPWTRDFNSLDAQDRRRAHAAADAHRDEAKAGLAAGHLVEERGRELRAAAAERMAKRDRAAVDVQPIGIDVQLAEAREHLRGEGLVDLDEVEAGERQAEAIQQFTDGGHRAGPEALGGDAGRGVAQEPRQRRQAELAAPVRRT